MQSIANIIAKFGANIGIDGLETENGVCTLQFDEVTVTLECGENDDTLYLYSRVCGLPEGDADKLALYGLLLELDSFYKGTDGGVLGIEPLLDAVTYTRRWNIWTRPSSTARWAVMWIRWNHCALPSRNCGNRPPRPRPPRKRAGTMAC